MLMFDNAIFASFIPQLLMLLGYLSCFLAPVIPTLSALNADLDLHESNFSSKEIAVNYTFSSQQSDVHYFDFQYDAEPLEFVEYTSNIVSTHITLFFGNSNVAFSSNWFAYSQFSRPPPFSC